MSVDSVLDAAFNTLLAKARQTPLETTLRPATINFVFGGGGRTLTTAIDPLLVEVPFASCIVWAHMYAGDVAGRPTPVAATIDVQWTRYETFGGATPLNGTGVAPTLDNQFKADVPLDGWNIYMTTGDVLVAVVRNITGLADFLALTLLLRPTDIPMNVSPVIDTGGNTLVDGNGNPVILGGA